MEAATICFKERSQDLPGNTKTMKNWFRKVGLLHTLHIQQAHSHAAPSDSADDGLRSAPESFPICRRQTDRRDKRNKLGNASTSSNVACIRWLLFISKTVRLMETVNLVYNNPCHFHLQLLFETFFVPINIQRLALEMPAEAHVGVHAVFVIVRFQTHMKYVDKIYLDLPISNENNTRNAHINVTLTRIRATKIF